MKFFLIDDDTSIRAMLTAIIEGEGVGTVEGEASDGLAVTGSLLNHKHIDILIIDLLMPHRDGIETIRELRGSYSGKTVMLSQIETKEMIAEAYSLGIDNYITKPINRVEVITILTKVKERILLEKSIQDIRQSLNILNTDKTLNTIATNTSLHSQSELERGAKYLLMELGIICESGHKDLLDILEILYEHEHNGNTDFPSLRELFEETVKRKKHISSSGLQKEAKSTEQRIRRAIHQSLDHIASLGINDFSNPIFENYASRYFDFAQVRMKMLELQGKLGAETSPARINIRKFIQVLYMDAKEDLQ